MAKQQSITSLPRSPEDDRHSRMVKYSITMAIRVVCIALCLVVQGWWLLVFAIGAVVLPYIAVVFANTVLSPNGPPVLRPGGLVPVQTAEPAQAHEPAQIEEPGHTEHSGHTKDQPTHDGPGSD